MCRGRCDSVTRVGVAVTEHSRRAVKERLADALPGDNRAHGNVPARESLRREDEVGVEAESTRSEPLAGAPKSANDLVADPEHVVLAAHLARFLEVLLAREAHTARSDDGLAKESGYSMGTDSLDGFSKVVGAVPTHPNRLVAEVAPANTVGLEARQLRACPVHAVVGVVAHEHHLTSGLIHHLPVAAHHLQRGVDRVGATRGEEHLGVGHRRNRGHALGERGGGLVDHVAKHRVVREAACLSAHCLGDLGATVPHVGEPEARGDVEVLVAVDVSDARARAL
ncbi:unannotated protein [freshwater metagenome]|uniref:Unannotated protein n=1 Tax=freshwater metagenome TaxID=449393 RepID=A0A6J7KL71_9ZZZZ